MAQVWCTGPAYIYVAPTGSPQFLGTAERAPVIDLVPAFLPVLNDLGGRLKPFDKSYQGEDGIVVARVNRWNEPVYQSIESATNNGTPGTDASGDIGTLMFQEDKAYEVWVVFPYAASKAAMSGMPSGYHFFGAWLEQDRLDPLGTEPRCLNLMWYCGRTFSPSTGAFTCYDYTISGLPNIN